MEQSDLKELSSKARIDGRRLFHASETIYNISIRLTAVIGIVGVISSFVALIDGPGVVAALLIATLTAVLCYLFYLVTVVSTHVSKVLVHACLATIAIAERQER
jgi:hypothetical protein